MPADPRLRAQIELIRRSLPGAAVFPQNWEETGEVDYLYRAGTVLARDRDEDAVTRGLAEILRGAGGEVPAADRPFARQQAAGGVVSIALPEFPADAREQATVPRILGQLDAGVGRGKSFPDHILYGCGYPCPATEPGEVPAGTTTPFPPPGAAACCGHPRPGCDGDGVFVSVVDTGLLPGAAAGHGWLAGVDGVPENPYDAAGNIVPYAGHGTFAAGCLRCAAPKTGVYVGQGFESAAAAFETDLVPTLEDALSRNPDVFVFTFTTSSRLDQTLVTFDDFYERRLRSVKGLVVVAPAGNDGWSRYMWPAAYPWVVSVGALSASWRDRASFSNHGGWVDVYAPGEDLVNAFAAGTYICNEPPIGQHRHFDGMARWSGTSFSTPIVAGLIAARMSATGQNGQQAARALLRFARGQAIPGAGAVLYPGQACCAGRHQPGGRGHHGGGCGCGCGGGCGDQPCGCGGAAIPGWLAGLGRAWQHLAG